MISFLKEIKTSDNIENFQSALHIRADSIFKNIYKIILHLIEI